MASPTGKVIIVTGSNSGFGRLTVEKLAREGHTVFATMRNVNGKNKQAAQELINWAKEEKYPVHVLELDVTQDQSVKKAVSKIYHTTGQIDVVVNNAGVGSGGITEAVTVEQAKALFDVNFFGPLRLNQAVLPYMRKQGDGLLVHITSILGRIPMAFMSIYNASKFALEGLADSWRFELEPLGIDSVIVEPGAYPTSFMTNAWVPEDLDTLEAYGEMAHAPEKMFEGVGQLFEGPQAPNPQEVADAIHKLVATPFGKRPARTVVDKISGSFIESLNTCSDESLAGVMKAFGN